MYLYRQPQLISTPRKRCVFLDGESMYGPDLIQNFLEKNTGIYIYM